MGDDLTRDTKQYNSSLSGGVILGYKTKDDVVAVDALHMRIFPNDENIVKAENLSSEQGIYLRTFPALSVLGFCQSSASTVPRGIADRVRSAQRRELSELPLQFILSEGELVLTDLASDSNRVQPYSLVSDAAEDVCMSFFSDVLFRKDVPKAVAAIYAVEEAQQQLSQKMGHISSLNSITSATNPYDMQAMSGNVEETEPTLYIESMVALSKAVAASSIVYSQPTALSKVLVFKDSSSNF